MVYTPEEKAKMDILLQAFQSYVDQQDQYDVVYSEKAGYLRVCTGTGADQIYFPVTGFADMMQTFTDDFLLDEEGRVGHYLKRDYDHVRSLMAPRLDALGELREEASRIMEETFNACRRRCENQRLEYLAEIRMLEELLKDLRDAVL